MGGDEWGPSDDQRSIEVIRAAVERGITLIDTADVYGLGHSEELIAEAVPTDSPVQIVTKAGWDIYTDPPVVGGARRRYDAEYLEHALDESLTRLRRAAVDVFLLHNPEAADLAKPETLATLRRLKLRGRARWVGASVGSQDDAAAAIAAGLDVVMVPFNAVRSWARHVLQAAAAAGVGLIGREPYERGLLTGRYGPGARFAAGDHRAEKGEAWLIGAQPAARRVRAVAERRGISMPEVALGYALSHGAISSVVAGARSVEQLTANVAAAATRLTDGDLAEISGALPPG
jgi:aryl-alcohol dehydrogenase-like predicted oxidoreductase